MPFDSNVSHHAHALQSAPMDTAALNSTLDVTMNTTVDASTTGLSSTLIHLPRFNVGRVALNEQLITTSMDDIYTHTFRLRSDSINMQPSVNLSTREQSGSIGSYCQHARIGGHAVLSSGHDSGRSDVADALKLRAIWRGADYSRSGQ